MTYRKLLVGILALCGCSTNGTISIGYPVQITLQKKDLTIRRNLDDLTQVKLKPYMGYYLKSDEHDFDYHVLLTKSDYYEYMNLDDEIVSIVSVKQNAQDSVRKRILLALTPYRKIHENLKYTYRAPVSKIELSYEIQLYEHQTLRICALYNVEKQSQSVYWVLGEDKSIDEIVEYCIVHER